MQHTTSSQTDHARLHTMRDEEIDFSDIPEVTAEMFARAVTKPSLILQHTSKLTQRAEFKSDTNTNP
jgi:hypothetical protein